MHNAIVDRKFARPLIRRRESRGAMREVHIAPIAPFPIRVFAEVVENVPSSAVAEFGVPAHHFDSTAFKGSASLIPARRGRSQRQDGWPSEAVDRIGQREVGGSK